jgi:hypothetical protein
MSQCMTKGVVDLGRADRIDISWPVDGISGSATAAVELDESGTWWALIIADGLATGYFAGPDYPSPSPAHVVATTSHARLKIIDGRVTVVQDGGFIRLR